MSAGASRSYSSSGPWLIRTTTAAQLEHIRTRLLAEAGQSLAAAERYRLSKQQGERNSTAIYAQRGLDAISAVALIDGVIYLSVTARRAHPSAAPRRAIDGAVR